MSGTEGALRSILLRPPFGRMSSANAVMLPLGQDEFATVDAFTPRNGTPILISSVDMLEMLSELASAAGEALREPERIFVQLAMPSTTRLPARLLEPDVLLLPSIGRLYREAADRGRRVVSIEQDLRRFPSEDFRNEVSLRWTDYRDGDERELTASLEALGLTIAEPMSFES